MFWDFVFGRHGKTSLPLHLYAGFYWEVRKQNVWNVRRNVTSLPSFRHAAFSKHFTFDPWLPLIFIRCLTLLQRCCKIITYFFSLLQVWCAHLLMSEALKVKPVQIMRDKKFNGSGIKLIRWSDEELSWWKFGSHALTWLFWPCRWPSPQSVGCFMGKRQSVYGYRQKLMDNVNWQVTDDVRWFSDTSRWAAIIWGWVSLPWWRSNAFAARRFINLRNSSMSLLTIDKHNW